jgi:hypothetical protein
MSRIAEMPTSTRTKLARGDRRSIAASVAQATAAVDGEVVRGTSAALPDILAARLSAPGKLSRAGVARRVGLPLARCPRGSRS